MHRRAVLCLLLSASLNAVAGASENTEAQDRLWTALQSGGHVIFIRHAITDPGIGDPANFKLGDCSTQRNLSERGREDARRIGAAFRHYQIPIAGVWASRWCRCVETARLAFGNVEPAAMLDSSFVDDNEAKQMKVREVMAFVGEAIADKENLVFVTHQVNIQELTGASPASGEMVVTKPDGSSTLRVVGRLPVPGE